MSYCALPTFGLQSVGHFRTIVAERRVPRRARFRPGIQKGPSPGSPGDGPFFGLCSGDCELRAEHVGQYVPCKMTELPQTSDIDPCGAMTCVNMVARSHLCQNPVAINDAQRETCVDSRPLRAATTPSAPKGSDKCSQGATTGEQTSCELPAGVLARLTQGVRKRPGAAAAPKSRVPKAMRTAAAPRRVAKWCKNLALVRYAQYARPLPAITLAERKTTMHGKTLLSRSERRQWLFHRSFASCIATAAHGACVSWGTAQEGDLVAAGSIRGLTAPARRVVGFRPWDGSCAPKERERMEAFGTQAVAAKSRENLAKIEGKEITLWQPWTYDDIRPLPGPRKGRNGTLAENYKPLHHNNFRREAGFVASPREAGKEIRHPGFTARFTHPTGRAPWCPAAASQPTPRCARQSDGRVRAHHKSMAGNELNPARLASCRLESPLTRLPG